MLEKCCYEISPEIYSYKILPINQETKDTTKTGDNTTKTGDNWIPSKPEINYYE